MRLTELNPSFVEESGRRYLRYTCPCLGKELNGQHHHTDLPVSDDGKNDDIGITWKIEGDDFATLSVFPSVRTAVRHDRECSHYYIKNGEIVMA